MILIAAVYLSADAVSGEYGMLLEEETHSPSVFGFGGGEGMTRIYITDTKLRRDDGNKSQSTIVRSDMKIIWMLDHEDSTYTEMTPDMVQGLGIMGMMVFGVRYDSLTGVPIVPDPLFIQTGEEKKIGRWLCRGWKLVETESGDDAVRASVTLWISGESGLSSSLYGSILRRMMGDAGEQYDPFFMQIDRLRGYPVYMETRLLGRTVTQKLVRFEKIFIPDSLFVPPSCYRPKNLN